MGERIILAYSQMKQFWSDLEKWIQISYSPNDCADIRSHLYPPSLLFPSALWKVLASFSSLFDSLGSQLLPADGRLRELSAAKNGYNLPQEVVGTKNGAKSKINVGLMPVRCTEVWPWSILFVLLKLLSFQLYMVIVCQMCACGFRVCFSVNKRIPK